jgi:hypothetical protein
MIFLIGVGLMLFNLVVQNHRAKSAQAESALLVAEAMSREGKDS